MTDVLLRERDLAHLAKVVGGIDVGGGTLEVRGNRGPITLETELMQRRLALHIANVAELGVLFAHREQHVAVLVY